jgi:hypothetical protein
MNQPASSSGNCPSCGAGAPPLLKHSKLAVCAFCNSTLFVDDAQVQSAGEKSVLTEVPSILGMGRRYAYGNWMFEPVGRIRFEYGDGRGYWDEWWVLLSDGKTKWISNDEGEYVIQNEMPVKGTPPPYEKFEVGKKIPLGRKEVLCTELDTGTCTGLEGQLPEVIHPGETHRYAHLEGAQQLLITAEYHDDSQSFYEGVWIDPFSIRSA